MTLTNEVLNSSSNQSGETEEESLDDESPCSPQNSLASDGNGFDHSSIEQTVHRVVQEVKLMVKRLVAQYSYVHLNFCRQMIEWFYSNLPFWKKTVVKNIMIEIFSKSVTLFTAVVSLQSFTITLIVWDVDFHWSFLENPAGASREKNARNVPLSCLFHGLYFYRPLLSTNQCMQNQPVIVKYYWEEFDRISNPGDAWK